jgi:type IV pilus assembly protein PilA
MVVVLIIAILIAIAIPTFLGARNRANDRAAQSSLRNALTAAKTSFTDTSDYSGATIAGLTAIEPSLKFQATSNTFTQVSVIAAPSGNTWWAEVFSKSGKCYGIEDNSSSGALGGTRYAGTATPLAAVAGVCTVPAADPSWADTRW